MALPNTEMLTSQLARLPDASLRQLAQMHKNDPYVLPLIISEDGRRKQMRAASQGQAGALPQPKVVDAAVQQIGRLPEEVGIAALPAPSMAGMPMGGITGEEEPQAMAGGGMVAFRDGGDVERYQTGGNIYERWKALYPRDKLLWGSGPTGYENMPLTDVVADMITKAASVVPTEEGERQKRARAAEEARMEALMKGYRSRPTMEPGEQEIAYEKANLAPTVTAAKAAQEKLAAKTAASGVPKPPAAAGAPGTKPVVVPDRLGDLNTLYTNILTGQNYTDPAAAQLKALETKELAAAQAEKAATERDQAKSAKAFEGREARLAERGTEIGKQKDMNVGLALLNAGFAIMSTPGGLATAIGKGAQVGTQQFASGLDKIRSAQERLDEARDRMDELKLNRDEMSAKEVRAAESKIRQVGIDAEKRGIDGLRQAAGVNRETAKTLFDKTVQVGTTREEIASRERTAAATANAQQNFFKALGEAKPDSPLRKGYEIAKQEGAVPKLFESYQKLAADETPTMGGTYATKGQAFRARFPAFEDFMAQYPGALGGGGGFTQPPAGATVLK